MLCICFDIFEKLKIIFVYCPLTSKVTSSWSISFSVLVGTKILKRDVNIVRQVQSFQRYTAYSINNNMINCSHMCLLGIGWAPLEYLIWSQRPSSLFWWVHQVFFFLTRSGSNHSIKIVSLRMRQAQGGWKVQRRKTLFIVSQSDNVMTISWWLIKINGICQIVS